MPTKFRDIVYNGELFKDHMIDFSYDIFDINHSYTRDELIQKKCITSAIFMLDQKVEAIEFLNRIKDIVLFFDGLSYKELQVLKHWIKNSVEDKLAETAVDILNSKKEEVMKMVAANANILTEMNEKSKAEGREEGIEIGEDKGIKKTLTVIQLSNAGKSICEIAQECELPESKVREILESVGIK